MKRHPPAPSSAGAPGTSLLIKNVRVLDPAAGLDFVGCLGIRGGRIDYRDRPPPAAAYADVIEGDGRWVMPGLVDLCARLREPGAEHKATMASEAPAALAAGITALCLPPDTRPAIDNAAVVARVNRIAKAAGGAFVYTLGALTQGLRGTALAEMSALKQAGVVGVSNAAAPLDNARVARRALEYAAGLELTVHVLALEASLAAGGVAHEGPVATRLGLPAIPVAAETTAIRQWLSLVEDTGARVHFGRLASARAVALIESAKARGLPVSADVAAHQLFLTEADLEDFNAMAHVIPPPRSAADREVLRAALATGVIDAVCSDHQPHEADAKINPLPLTEPGISALETLLPLTLSLVEEGGLGPLAAAARLSAAPARILGIAGGSLAPGAVADLVLIDPRARRRLDARHWRSAGHNTPFFGYRLPAPPLGVWRAGMPALVYS
ncbi:MAG: dihydroorotase [Gammaproteobacteria bacterium]|nr:dihydroorotase [Gammaproteobacteria bacterium]